MSIIAFSYCTDVAYRIKILGYLIVKFMQCASACMGKSGTDEKLHFLKYDNHFKCY